MEYSIASSAPTSKSNRTFYKYQGAGNDFLLFEEPFSSFLERKAVSALCDRHHGIGADGLLQVERIEGRVPSIFVWRMRLYNPDGTTAAMCGNGLRCLGAHIRREQGLSSFFIETEAGRHALFVRSLEEEEKKTNLYSIESSFGKIDPSASQIKKIDFSQTEKWVDPLALEAAFFLDSGVPHLCFLTKMTLPVRSLELEAFGRFWRKESAFAPYGTNVSLAYIENPCRLQLLTYERGVEKITRSCGTGAVAAAAALLLFQKKPFRNQRIEIEFPGEPPLDLFCALDGEFWLTGPAAFVFETTLEKTTLL